MIPYSLLSSIFGLQSCLMVAVSPSEVAFRYRRPNMARRDTIRSKILRVFPRCYTSGKSSIHNRSAVITPHVAHTDASMQRIQNTHNIVDGNLHVNVASHTSTQRAEGARTKEMGNRTAAVSWE